METAGRVQVVAFDKTGTLTNSRPVVTDLLPVNGASEEELLQVAGALETRSEHPLAEAILRAASDKDIGCSTVEGFTAITGRGAQGKIAGRTYYIGSPRLFWELGLALAPHQSEISRLQKVVMLTGDNRVTGEAIGRRLGRHGGSRNGRGSGDRRHRSDGRRPGSVRLYGRNQPENRLHHSAEHRLLPGYGGDTGHLCSVRVDEPDDRPDPQRRQRPGYHRQRRPLAPAALREGGPRQCLI